MDSASGKLETAKVLAGHFDFDPKDAVYRDHFPGMPVVPGSLIIHAFLEAAKNRRWIEGTCRVKGFRFLRFVSPGKHRFRMVRETDNVLACTLEFDGRPVAEGRLVP